MLNSIVTALPTNDLSLRRTSVPSFCGVHQQALDTVRFSGSSKPELTEQEKAQRKAKRKKIITGVSLMAAGTAAIVASVLLKASVIGIPLSIAMDVMGAGLIIGGIWALVRKLPITPELASSQQSTQQEGQKNNILPPNKVSSAPLPLPVDERTETTEVDEKQAFLNDQSIICFHTARGGYTSYEFKADGKLSTGSEFLKKFMLVHRDNLKMDDICVDVRDYGKKNPRKVLSITLQEVTGPADPKFPRRRTSEYIGIVSPNDQLSPIQQRILNTFQNTQTLPALVKGLNECVDNGLTKPQLLETLWHAGQQDLDGTKAPTYMKDIIYQGPDELLPVQAVETPPTVGPMTKEAFLKDPATIHVQSIYKTGVTGLRQIFFNKENSPKSNDYTYIVAKNDKKILAFYVNNHKFQVTIQSLENNGTGRENLDIFNINSPDEKPTALQKLLIQNFGRFQVIKGFQEASQNALKDIGNDNELNLATDHDFRSTLWTYLTEKEGDPKKLTPKMVVDDTGERRILTVDAEGNYIDANGEKVDLTLNR